MVSNDDPLIVWDASFSVGINTIDTQHQRLVDLINQLHAAMRDRQTQDALKGIVAGLTEYAVEHFQTEEEFFDRCGYDEADTHKQEHAKFVETVADFKSGFEEGRLMLSMDIMNFLKDWLVGHIQNSDRKYGPFLISKGVN